MYYILFSIQCQNGMKGTKRPWSWSRSQETMDGLVLIEHVQTLPLLVETKGLIKSYGGIRALNSIDFAVKTGTVHALLGENSAGKSTLIKILSGAIKPDGGSIRILAQKFEGLTPSQALQAGIATVYQETSLFSDLSVLENLFVGRYSLNAYGWIDWKTLRSEAKAVFDRLGVAIPLEKPVGELGRADMQIVEIARALVCDKRLLILDEPTAALTKSEVDTLLNLLRTLASKGTGIIYISHHLDEIFRVADEITVLRDGAIAAFALAGNVDKDWIVTNMIGHSLSHYYGPPVKRNGVLVDSIGWDRNVRKIRHLAESTESQVWFGHDAQQFAELVKSNEGCYE